MDARPTGPAGRNSVDNDLLPNLHQRHDSLSSNFNAQSAGPELPFTPSLMLSRNPSPSRSEEYHSDDNVVTRDRDSSVVNGFLTDIFGEDSKEQRALIEASRTAHITKQSLAELDIVSIINNSKLRHDVNFDRELHFRPNMDGERGRRKHDAQVLYWRAIAAELHLVFYMLSCPTLDEDRRAGLIQQCSQRLPQLFETTKEIIKNLVPERDQSDVNENLDVTLLMQKISRGVCNFVSIAEWIAQLLKQHCAPMRDEMVGKMVEKIQTQHPDSITAGLVDLFNVLEAMKLDVANHQIRHLRALLIEDTINFEKKYHTSRIQKDKYDCNAARKWYKDARETTELMKESWPNKDVAAFVRGFVRLLLPTTASLPDTFILDSDRIRALHADVDECIRESICCDVLRTLVGRRGSTLSLDDEASFRKRLQSIAADRTSIWYLHAVNDISCEIVRFALQAAGSSLKVDAELEDVALEMLRSRLGALGRARTETALGPSDKKGRASVEEYAQQLFDQLFSRTVTIVQGYLTSSPYDIFLALVPPPAPPPLCPMPPNVRPVDRQRDLVRRIAHIAVLHWRTWEGLVYNKD